MIITINNMQFTITGEVENIYKQFDEFQLQTLNDECNELADLDKLFNSDGYDNFRNRRSVDTGERFADQVIPCLIFDVAYCSNNIITPLFKCCGPICLYQKGELVKQYPALLLCLKEYKRGNLYGFGNGIIPTKGKQDFFGVSIQQPFKEKGLANLDTIDLNNWIKMLISECTKHPNVDSVFYLKYGALCCLFDSQDHTFGFQSKFTNPPDDDLKSSAQNALNILLERYTHDGICGIQKVDNLSNLIGPGIYIISVKTEAKYYVGQTRKCLKDRIVQHFTKPQTTFDKEHGIDDVDAIYYINMNGREYLMEYIDLFEQDIISCIPNQHLCNSLAGGVGTIMSIDEKLEPQNYMKELISYLIS